MKKIEIMPGNKFERLIILREARRQAGHRRFMCRCDCGKEKIVGLTHLRTGLTRSCGCIQKEGLMKRITKHGQSKTRFYNIWVNIKDRCYNPNNRAYKNYGGRGIVLEDKWHAFENFRKDMEKDYIWHTKTFGIKNTTIERINVDGNYSHENCHWATQMEQGRNKRGNIKIELLGHSKTSSEWAEFLGIDKLLFKSKIKTLRKTYYE